MTNPTILANATMETFVQTVMRVLNRFENCGIDVHRLVDFVTDVAQLYHDAVNPYHNIRHALHVFHSMHLFLSKLRSSVLKDANEMTLLAAYVAALCHDTGHAKSIRANCVSPQEMHHVFVTLDLLKKNPFVRDLKFQQLVAKFILVTNIAHHRDFMSNYESKNKHRVEMRGFVTHVCMSRLEVNCFRNIKTLFQNCKNNSTRPCLRNLVG